jgi:hypothetical protein
MSVAHRLLSFQMESCLPSALCDVIHRRIFAGGQSVMHCSWARNVWPDRFFASALARGLRCTPPEPCP